MAVVIFSLLGLLPPARTECQEAAGGGPPGAAGEKALIEEGFRHLESRRYHQAIQSFERALVKSPSSREAREGLARAHAGLGVEFVSSGELRPAREAFERALRMGEDPVARFGLGYVDFLEVRDGPARDNLERALSQDPEDARAHKLLALIEYRRGDTPAARKRIERAASLDPQDQEAQALRTRWTKEEEVLSKLVESSTRHFLVRADRSLHPDGVREILGLLESIHDSLGQSLGHWSRARIPVMLMAERDFYDATGSHHWVGGMYDGQIKVPVKEEDGKPGAERKTLTRTLRHEYVHVLVKEISPGCPNWLNEGIAQYFELEEEREGIPGGSSPRALRGSKLRGELLKIRASRLPLAKIPARMSEISDQAQARLSYLEGLGFVSYLVEKHRAFRLRLLLSAYRRESSLTRAFQATYGAELTELEERWWRSLEG